MILKCTQPADGRNAPASNLGTPSTVVARQKSPRHLFKIHLPSLQRAILVQSCSIPQTPDPAAVYPPLHCHTALTSEVGCCALLSCMGVSYPSLSLSARLRDHPCVSGDTALNTLYSLVVTVSRCERFPHKWPVGVTVFNLVCG